jgi:phosphodiesterase/alkaline phosphatase D-like protein
MILWLRGNRSVGAKAARRVRLTFEILEGRLIPSVTFFGVAAGDPTSQDAILWTRALDPNQPQAVSLIAEVSTDPGFNQIYATYLGRTDPSQDYTVKVDATGLQSGTQYYYRFLTGNGDASPVGKLKTAPDPTAAVGLHFGFSGDADGQWRPYDSTAHIAGQNFDFFTFLGDTIYETASTGSPAAADPYANPAQALADYRRKYREQLKPVNTNGFPGLQSFFASQANYTLLDNHELGNMQFQNGGAPAGVPSGKGVDASNSIYDVNTTGTFMNKTPGFQTLVQAYDNYEPIRERIISAPDDPRIDGTQQLYFAQQWGANSIFFNLDDRSYRDIRLKTPTGADDTGPRADNPDRTMLGQAQLSWFEQSLLDAKNQGITWKFVAISSPIDQIGPIGGSFRVTNADGTYLTFESDGGKSWMGGYRAERNQLLQFIADNHIDHVIFLTTDDHQVRINELGYFAVPGDQSSYTRVPGCFQILVGPLGAQGPDDITNHSFNNIKSIADSFASQQEALGVDPIGLDPAFPGLANVYRDGDPDADRLRQPVDFYSPDTFNYASLSVSPDGGTLTVSVYGINSFAANTFPEPGQVGPERLILSFQIHTTVISSLSSNLANESSTLTVNGANFTASSVVRFNGVNAPSTTFVSSTRLLASVPEEGSYTLTVFDPATGTSNGVAFTSTDAPLTVASLTPPNAAAGQAFSNVTVAHFTDANPNGTASDYTALVTLGDGTSVTLTSTPTSNGQIVAHAGGGFDVQLSYRYAHAVSNRTFAVQVTDDPATTSASTTTFGVSPDSTATTVSSSSTSAVYGQAVTFTATVGNTTTGSNLVPTGRVQFFIDGIAYGSAVTLDSGGHASITDAGLPVAGSPHGITVSFTNSDGDFSNSNGSLAGGQTVTRAPLTITADNKTRVYGQANPTLTASYSGFVNGDTPAVVSGLMLTTTATSGSGVGPYPITGSGASAANYSISYVNGTLSVTPAALTITANNRNKAYGQAVTFAGTEFTTLGLLNSDTVSSVTLTSTGAAATASVTGSPYAIVPSAAVGTGLTNYSISYVNGQLTVNRTALTVTANNRSKTYGQAVTFAGTEFMATGLVNSDTVTRVTLTSTGAAATATVAGSPYAIVPSAAQGSGLGNYSISYVNGSLTVSPAALTITANSRSKTYGQTVTFAGTEFTPSGLVNGDTVSSVTLTSTGAAGTATVAGSPYAIGPSAAVGTGLANYSVSYVNGQLTVNRAALTITANNRSKTYGQAVSFAGTEFTTMGLLNSDTVTSVTLTSAGAVATAAVAGSPYPIVPSAAVGTGLTNYSVSYVNGQLTVNRVPLTVTADNKTKVAGNPLPPLTASYSGFVLGEGPSVLGGTLNLQTTNTDTAGMYPITASGLTAANYAITYVPGTLTVTPAATSTFGVTGFPSPVTAGTMGMFTVTARDAYGNTTPAYTGTVQFRSTDPQAVLPAARTLTNGVSTFAATLATAGSQALTALDTVNSSLTGTQAGIVVNPAAASTLVFSGLPASATAGVTYAITLTALDPYSNVATGYTGTVHFRSTDPLATLPGDYTFMAADAGSQTFGVILRTSGTQTLTAADTATSTLTANASAVVAEPVFFGPATRYAVGRVPEAVAVGDFNGDGIPDLAVANAADNTVSILLGNGDGTFQAPRAYAAGDGPVSVVAADLNGDGILDLAVADLRGDRVSVLLGNGDGTFRPARAYTTGWGPIEVAVADLNGDGIPDLVTANSFGLTVSILLGVGDGTFRPARNIAAGFQPASVAVVDLNADGVPDLAVADFAGNSVNILLGNGDGTFQWFAAYRAAAGPAEVAVGDFNGDGIPDLVVACQNANAVSVLLGNGDGSFGSAQVYAAGRSPDWVAVGDIDGDGLPDLVVSDYGANQVVVLPGNPDGTFRPPVSYAVGVQPLGGALADFNGDGFLDVAVADAGDNTVSVLLNPAGAPTSNAGSRSGAGTTAADVTQAAMIDVGGRVPAGVLTITDNFTRISEAVPNQEVGAFDDGASEQRDHGRMAALDDIRSIRLRGRFFARDGDTDRVLTWGCVRGDFAMMDLPDLGVVLYVDPAPEMQDIWNRMF